MTENACENLHHYECKSSLEVGGGIGLFTKVPLSVGSKVATIPQSCVLTTTKALKTQFGQAIQQAISKHPQKSDEFILLMWMAIGRKDVSHPFHPYLASLPQEPVLPLSWPDSMINTATTLLNTNLGDALAFHRTLVYGTYADLIKVVRETNPNLLPGKYSKRRRSNVAVIIEKLIFISSIFFYCLLLNHSFQTNPNKITNCFKLILSIYNFTNYICSMRSSIFDF